MLRCNWMIWVGFSVGTSIGVAEVLFLSGAYGAYVRWGSPAACTPPLSGRLTADGLGICDFCIWPRSVIKHLIHFEILELPLVPLMGSLSANHFEYKREASRQRHASDGNLPLTRKCECRGCDKMAQHTLISTSSSSPKNVSDRYTREIAVARCYRCQLRSNY
jgi:hypothetical protein